MINHISSLFQILKNLVFALDFIFNRFSTNLKKIQTNKTKANSKELHTMLTSFQNSH